MGIALSPTMVSRKLIALAFIKSYLAEFGVSPSYGEIAAHLGTNRQRVRDIVKQLLAEGLITWRGGHRGIGLPSDIELALRTLRAAGFTSPVTNPPLPLVPELYHLPDL